MSGLHGWLPQDLQLGRSTQASGLTAWSQVREHALLPEAVGPPTPVLPGASLGPSMPLRKGVDTV